MSRGAEERGRGRDAFKGIQSHQELEVYRMAFETAMQVFEASKLFPREEMYALMDQMRRSSRSVCGNIAEAWRKRRYEAAFVSKLNDAEAEAAETQTWLHFAIECGYLPKERGVELDRAYDQIIGKLVNMIIKTRPWLIVKRGAEVKERRGAGAKAGRGANEK